ncbi:molybdopterin binding protein domain protein [Sporothrix brasiliensis 5110]|uniref:Molybdopterin binding protein domain protein n=1 Tax=Sporothrix brasiliensis 5110 TaxID=1398154 RepID=A0A0C2FUW7_9PEZI|nr:molybdopterin binding protein domain protein [Sporothrix brasiliensis 5110]KIH94818.1 molybdopterin binding protein domain protein [Sporothrix brasiliensis 5110]
MSQRLTHILRHVSAPTSPLLRASASASASAPASPFSASARPDFASARNSLTAARPTLSAMAELSTAARNHSKPIHTAACLIIGDEVLGGKTKDTNSAYVAKWCFSLGISLKRVEVIEDDESQIIEAVRRMSDNYDFVVTSGGIGPTHDDITYPSIAKAFGLEIKLYDEAYRRMREISIARPRPNQPVVDWDVDSPALRARLRMVELPTDPAIPAETQFVFPREDLWVPVCVVNGNVHILPGVPRLFEMLLDNLTPLLLPRLEGRQIARVLISTPLPESVVAPYLTALAARVEPQGVKVGSYPRWERKRNTVTLVGKDAALLESLVAEVVENVQGRRISVEGEDDESGDET